MDLEKSQKELNQNCREHLAKESDIVARFRCAVLLNGAGGIKTIARKFRIMDDSNNKRLSLNEFIKACKECGIRQRSEEDLTKVFKIFDKDHNGELDYEEFLRAVRPTMNDHRQKLVKKAFDKINVVKTSKKEIQQEQVAERGVKGANKINVIKTPKKEETQQEQEAEGSEKGAEKEEEVISVDDMKKAYDVSCHPKFKNGEMTESQVIKEFLKSFEAEDHANGEVTLDEFMDYYAGISAGIDKDPYFNLMMWNSWGVSD